jgi:hypothetical protein
MLKPVAAGLTAVCAGILCAAPFSVRVSPDAGVSLSLDTAAARIGRPLTPMSVAGVHRRAIRRAYYGYGAAAGLYGYGYGTSWPSSYYGYSYGSNQPSTYYGSSYGSYQPSSYYGYSYGSNQPSTYYGSSYGSNQPSSYYGYSYGSNQPTTNYGYSYGSKEPTTNYAYSYGSNQPSANYGYSYGSNQPTTYYGSGNSAYYRPYRSLYAYAPYRRRFYPYGRGASRQHGIKSEIVSRRRVCTARDRRPWWAQPALRQVLGRTLAARMERRRERRQAANSERLIDPGQR